MSSSTAIAIPQRRRKQSRASGSANASPANTSFEYGSYGSVRNEDGATTPKAASQRRPSLIYANFDFDDLERKQDPVEEIVVTDEERAKMFPS
ncbi:hypothetical protein SLS60_008836 [Paraconiothyrium brasiliense]|uniref:Uncharacterized protein n=1 Tax=Paraconiothyrium brasiliense TaxID=300254 RepID=A0ABR3QZR8_9PLEO